MSAIAVHDLTKTFGRGRLSTRLVVRSSRRHAMTALEGVSFDVGGGEVVALTGANGSGKSTLLRVLATLLLPTRGQVHVAGHDVHTESAMVRRTISFVPADDRSFTFTLTGRENLEFFAALHGTPKARVGAVVDDALDRVGLVAAADDAYASYSSGMRQRLALARSIASDAKVLLLDEPFRALDEHAQDGLREVVADRARSGATVVVATHDTTELQGVWTRVLHLEHGVLTGNTPMVEAR